jgi:AmmeMemoRadiSam system protein A
MAAARALGGGRGTVISYANSGDAPVGEPDRVVGYGAVMFSAGGEADGAAGGEGGGGSADSPGGAGGADGAAGAGGAAGADRAADRDWARGAAQKSGAAAAALAGRPDAGRLSATDRRALFAIARGAIGRYLETGTAPLTRDCSPALSVRQGAFVTLKKHGALRGCIGHMAEDTPLCQVVAAMALRAAFDDQRFVPLARDEFAAVEIEISVLTPARPVPGPDAVVTGRDGVILRKSGHSAVFLPQVATEQGWDRDTYLTQLARKAGLPGDAWRSGAELLTFQAEVYRERDLP